MPPRYEEYRNHFPVGVWWSGSTIDIEHFNGAYGTTLISPGDANGTNHMLNDRQHGYIANKMNYALWYFSVPESQEDSQAVSDKLDNNRVGGPIWHVVGPTGRTVTGNDNTGIQAEYFNQPSGFWTDSNADAIAGPIVDNYEDHPSLLGYHLQDDVVAADANALAITKMAAAIQRADPYGRPAFFVHVFPNAGNLWDDYDCKVAFTYRYPCGKYSDNTDTAEGDFMSHRLSDSPQVSGSSHPDWVDALRWWMGYVPTGARAWWCLQTHNTNSGTNLSLREPTDRELRKQFWIAIGEGVKGIFWFRGDNITADSTSKGVFDVNRKSSLAVIRELSDRLSPQIRQRLLKCNRVADLFTTSGGSVTFPKGTNYPSAYKSTLLHEDGTRYVVICNHSTSTQNITINSGTLVGRLRNMETNTYIRVGGTWSLPPLDGTIFEFVPDLGVPTQEPIFSFFSVETWWATHWANPTSSNYIPVGNILTHPTEVVVAPGGLQAAINAASPYTTFRLQAGIHPRVTIVGKGHLHFIADNPANKPTCRGFDIYGTSYAQQYNTRGTDYGYPHHLTVLKTAEALLRHRNPTRDFIFRNIDFESDGSLVNWEYYMFDDGYWSHDHWYTNAAIGMRAVQDVLIESCTADGYVAGTNLETREGGTGAFLPPPDPAGFDTSSGPTGHPGVFWGNSGIRNIIMRDVEIWGPPSTRGFPYAIFFDGPQGCVFEDITLHGKFAFGDLLFLTNDDYTFDVDYDGRFDKGRDTREPWCNVCANWVSDKTGVGQTNGYAITGGNNLFKNMQVTNHTGNLTWVFQFTTKVAGTSYFKGNYYLAYGNVVDNFNLTHGSCTHFLQVDADQGVNATVTASNPYRSHTGYHTVKNSHVNALTTAWVQNVETQVLVDGTTTLDNNTVG